MQNRFLIGVGIFLAIFLCMAGLRHYRAKAAADLIAQDSAPAESASSASTDDTLIQKPRRPIVHGLPTSTDAGNLAMQWIEWTSAEGNQGFRLPEQEIEKRLPYLRQVREKLADMSLQDDCAKAAQRAEVASMDADLTYFQMQMDNAHTPVGPDPELVKQSEDRAASDAYAQSQNAYQMAMKCTTP
ncbi:hypothetical protein [Dyella nitratireducens]|uniref:Secreted protein n=1 Tax=Dyella nitratireducens TaxID=1849580 RepID=A0ABQ1FUC0_9GAMM|nr:hypothetical protein [Dyella nitratireducens]GGA29795.1 hypothetical protein GCM10010981_18410 [Dyella nitratireducens]GLQ43095.1 hypothetical protein GCM10007902_29450 [Dyella nitratireducens]